MVYYICHYIVHLRNKGDANGFKNALWRGEHPSETGCSA